MDKQTILRVFPPDSVVIETHLSYVVLAGQYAWKFKKAVKYPFVDQSTLELRRALCEKEISLNKRYAPTIYIGVVCLKRNGELSVDLPENQEEVLDFAVHMNRFDLEGDKALAQGLLTRPIVARFASDIASIHNSITPCVDSVGTEQKDQLDNVEFLECNAPPNADVAKLRKWIEQEGERVAQLIEKVEGFVFFFNNQTEKCSKRRREGRVKECHGDLHLTNTVLLEGKLIAFDCLEFSLGLRMIDVCCDVAFFVMDMDFRKQKGLGAAFLSAYLERSGDYEALGLLRYVGEKCLFVTTSFLFRLQRYFLVYRTLVRAKIHCISRNYDRMAEHVKVLSFDFVSWFSFC
jgi:aminoglycoside phosphotransferase family enzyme